MTAPIVLTLPYPVSANRYWRVMPLRGEKGNRQIVIRSKEADAYRERVGWLLSQAGVRKPLQGRIEVAIELYPARPQDWAKRAAKNPIGWDDDVRCMDLDNARKVLFDSLKGLAFADDRWIWADSARRMEPDGEARVVVTITPLALPAHPQGDLLGEAA